MTRTRRDRTAAALGRVIGETRSVFHRLRHVAEVIHATDHLSAGERGVLVELADQGPRAVPDMARARPVSRQHIQTLVNSLLARALVELVPNPKHRRSKLVRLTPTGATLVETVKAREARVLAGVSTEIDIADLDRTAKTLARFGMLLAQADLEPPAATRRRHAT